MACFFPINSLKPKDIPYIGIYGKVNQQILTFHYMSTLYCHRCIIGVSD